MNANLNYFLLCSFICFYNTVFSQFVLDKRAKNPYLNLNYDSVVLYHYNLNKFVRGGFGSLETDTVKIKSLKNDFSKVLTLTTEEQKELHEILIDTTTYGGGCSTVGLSYLVVYYLKNEIVALLNIDLIGNCLTSSFEFSPERYYNVIYEDESWVSSNEGFSQKGKDRLKKYLSKLGFIELSPR